MHIAFIGIIAASVLAADQLSKHLIETRVASKAVIPVCSFVNIVHFDNRGISFGLLASESSFAPGLLALIGAGIIALLMLWARNASGIVPRAALAAMIGGALSNVLDRLGDGGVTDFLDFHIGLYHWPAFNLADTAIVCGMIALLLSSASPAPLRIKDAPR